MAFFLGMWLYRPISLLPRHRPLKRPREQGYTINCHPNRIDGGPEIAWKSGSLGKLGRSA
jgi:hypothetical protein